MYLVSFFTLWYDPSSAPIGVLTPAVALEIRERTARARQNTPEAPQLLFCYYVCLFVLVLLFVAGRGVGVMLLAEAFLFVVMVGGRMYIIKRSLVASAVMVVLLFIMCCVILAAGGERNRVVGLFLRGLYTLCG